MRKKNMFKSDYSILYILLILPAAVAIAYFLYRKQTSPQERKTPHHSPQHFDISNTVLLLFPVISYLSDESITPVNIILIDNSKSLILENRDSILNETVNDLYSKTGNGVNFRYYLFSNGLIREYEENKPADLINTDTTIPTSAKQYRPAWQNG